jgi:hypothetical protein
VVVAFVVGIGRHGPGGRCPGAPGDPRGAGDRLPRGRAGRDARHPRRHAYGAIATTVIGVALLGYGMFAVGVETSSGACWPSAAAYVSSSSSASRCSRRASFGAGVAGRPAGGAHRGRGGAPGARTTPCANPSRTAVTAGRAHDRDRARRPSSRSSARACAPPTGRPSTTRSTRIRRHRPGHFSHVRARGRERAAAQPGPCRPDVDPPRTRSRRTARRSASTA